MRILYDGRVFQMQKAGGVSRVFAEVISGLPADYHPVIIGVGDFGKNVPSHPIWNGRPLSFSDLPGGRGSSPCTNWRARFGFANFHSL